MNKNSYPLALPDRNHLTSLLKRLMLMVPDKAFLSFNFRRKMKQSCCLKDPKTFNQKMQWLKIFDRKPFYTDLCDKIKAKILVAQEIGQQHVLPTFAVYQKVSEIDISKLPDRFVLKCNHDCGSVTICRDKKTFDEKLAKKLLKARLKRNSYNGFREWPYKNIERKVFAEQYMESEDGSSLIDYKFFCFNGEPKFLYVSQGLENHSTAAISFFDLDGKRLNFKRSDFKAIQNFKIPDNFGELKEIASRLAKFSQSKFVRIDLYTINGNIYFSEFTFFPCGGYLPFDPKEADAEIGKMLSLK